tara:strand:- start:2059 stop:2841 length:783 start_codon:yes stop_codon:yes gene_type:complete
MIVDSHCHLDFDPLNKNLDKVLRRANDVGVKCFLTICTEDLSFKKILNILKEHENVYGTYGIHPHEAKLYKNLTAEKIKKNLLKNEKIIGIGETGLDFYYNHSDKQSQKESFLKHIQATQEASSTLIVHSREAEKETFDILHNEIKNKNFKVLMHCFTGSKEFAHKLLDIGCYFSASGIVTFKNSHELNEVFKSIPDNKILLETDSPYLSPEPNRGKVNEPSHIIHTLKHISKIKNQTEKNLALTTSKNFFKLFNMKIAI